VHGHVHKADVAAGFFDLVGAVIQVDEWIAQQSVNEALTVKLIPNVLRDFKSKMRSN
jgi:hypothetical protein